MATLKKKTRTPLFHIVKRDQLPLWKGLLVRLIAIVLALAASGALFALLSGESPLSLYISMFNGVFETSLRRWNLFQNLAILLCISLAVTPAFKMKFWNCGAEGQVLIGGLATTCVMMFLGGSLPYPLLIIVMVIAALLAGILWAVLPAIFQVKWGTNETLFTLMMNYIAIQTVAWFLKTFVKNGSGVLPSMPEYGLPTLFDMKYLLNILIVAILTILIFIYLKYSKQGYEISVVGESQNTAKYIGINVKKVVIRTMVVSGAICGLAGLLLVGGTNHTINTETVGGQGFTAIMVSWLAKFNPLTMILTTFLIIFLNLGASQVATDFRSQGIDSSISDIFTGIILLFIIGCEFFLHYKLVFGKSEKEGA